MLPARVLVIIALAVCALALHSTADSAQWAKFKAQYNKAYTTPADEFKRFQIFSNNLKAIKHLNELEGSEVFGVTRFADLTPAEFRARYLGYKKMNFDKNVPVLPPVEVSSVPSSIDWSQQGATTPVYDQGQCGSCWAFSAVEQIESMSFLQKKVSTIQRLSQQQIVDCDTTASGCNGGDTTLAYKYVMKSGLESSADYPYDAQDGKCKYSSSDVDVSISGWAYVTQSHDETAMLNYVGSTGPVSICVDASSWQYYTGGIITKGCGDTLDHCVQIVGYGTASSVDYWLVRNSWGTTWGEKGFLRVERNKNLCGISDEVTTVTASS